MDLEKKLADLIDKKTIEDLITWRFARAIDWLDVEAAKELFHEGARFMYDEVDMDAHAFCEAFGQSATALKMRSHFIGCAAVAIEGDKARGETYAIYAATRPAGDSDKLEDYIVSCRYLTEIEKRDEFWRMTSVHIVFDWSMGQPTPPKTFSGNTYNYGLDINHPLYRKI